MKRDGVIKLICLTDSVIGRIHEAIETVLPFKVYDMI